MKGKEVKRNVYICKQSISTKMNCIQNTKRFRTPKKTYQLES